MFSWGGMMLWGMEEEVDVDDAEARLANEAAGGG